MADNTGDCPIVRTIIILNPNRAYVLLKNDLILFFVHVTFADSTSKISYTHTSKSKYSFDE